MPLKHATKVKLRNAMHKIRLINASIKGMITNRVSPIKSYEDLRKINISNIEATFNNILERTTQKGLYSKQRKVNMFEYNKSKKRWYNLDSDSKLRGIWDFILLLNLFYILFIVPKSFVFGEADTNIINTIIDYWIDCFFIIDLFLQFMTINVINGLQIYDIRINCLTYLKGWFMFDLICAFPLSWILQGIGSNISTLSMIVAIKQALRLIRILNIPRKLTSFFIKFNISPITTKIILTTICLFFAIHLIACGYWYIILIEYGGYSKCPTDSDVQCWINYCVCDRFQIDPYILNSTNTNWNTPLNFDSWVPSPYISLLSIEHQYMVAFFWGITTITSVGLNITPRSYNEYIFSSIIIVIGVIFYGIIIANITTIFQSLNIDEIERIGRLDKLRSYLRKQKVPPIYYENITKLVEAHWKNEDPSINTNIQDILNKDAILLLKKLVWKDIIYKYPLLKLVDIDTYYFIVSHFKKRVYLEGEFICNKYQPGDEFYFIESGKVDAVALDDITVFYTVYPGEHFGEKCILTQGIVRRECSFRAVTTTHVHILERRYFNSILHVSPEFYLFLRDFYNVRSSKVNTEFVRQNKNISNTSDAVNIMAVNKKIFKIAEENYNLHRIPSWPFRTNKILPIDEDKEETVSYDTTDTITHVATITTHNLPNIEKEPSLIEEHTITDTGQLPSIVGEHNTADTIQHVQTIQIHDTDNMNDINKLISDVYSYKPSTLNSLYNSTDVTACIEMPPVGIYSHQQHLPTILE